MAEAFADHRKESQGHLERLEAVFEMLDMEPSTEKCDGIDGLIEEHDSFVEADEPDQKLRNIYNLIAGQKTEHYGIAAYENLSVLGERLGMDDADDLIQENLKEEATALEKLTDLIEEYDHDKCTEAASD